MTNTVISVEHLSKQYDLGIVGTGSLIRDFERWWGNTKFPLLLIDEQAITV